ncbi:hypothetical protein IFR05_008219 [Cadophora sp. M221]|nr:hypothetical protein IFR05_008219 [Cadophora sp. M221]
MEIAGFAASVVALVEVSVNITVWCVQYTKDVRHADEDIANLCREIGGLQTVLVRLQASSISSELLVSLKPVLDGCLEDMGNLTLKLKPSEGWRRTRQVLIWPFLKRGELIPWIERMERHKSLLTAAMAVDLLEMNRRIEHHLEDMKVKLKDSQDEIIQGVSNISDLLNGMKKSGEDEILAKQREGVLKWLAVVDYQSNFTNSLSLWEPGTGIWFTESVACREWLQLGSEARRNLWLSGPAGSGKTVLIASVLKVALESVANPDVNIPGSIKACVLYFFFDFKDEAKRVTRNMLLSILHQQAVYVPEISESLLELSTKGPTHESATNDELFDEIQRNASNFWETRFVIDALDECQDLDVALSFLQRLDKQTPAGTNLLVLVSSRDEVKIHHGLHSTNFEKLPVSQASVDNDIRKYVEKRVQQDDQQRFSCFSDAIKRVIVTELCSNSQGIDVREALRCLPETLDDTYQRILKKIHPSERKWAFRALTWLCGARSPMTLGMLEEAIAIDLDNFEVDEEDRLFNSEYILKILGSLVKVRHEDKYPQVMVIELAHFSVQQYLEKPGELEFYFPPSTVHIHLAKACLAYSTSKTFETALRKLDSQPDEQEDTKEDLWLFLHYCTTVLFEHLCAPGVEVATVDFALQRFNDPVQLSQYHTHARLAHLQDFSRPRNMYAHYGWRQQSACGENMEPGYSASVISKAAAYRLRLLSWGLIESRMDTSTIDDAFWTPICYLVAAGEHAHVRKVISQLRAGFEKSYSPVVRDLGSLLYPVMQPLGSALIVSVSTEKTVTAEYLWDELMWYINLPHVERGWSSYFGKLLRILLNISALHGAKTLVAKLMEVLVESTDFDEKEKNVVLQETIHCAAQTRHVGSKDCVEHILATDFRPKIRTASFRSNKLLHARLAYEPDLMRIAHADWLGFCDPQILLMISESGETIFETHPDHEKENILLAAVDAANKDTGFLLMEKGLDIHSADTQLESTFWTICRLASPNTSIRPQSSNQYFQFLDALLSSHPIEDEKAKTGLNGALIECCLYSNSVGVVRLLLQHGADPNAILGAKKNVKLGMSGTCGTALIAASMAQSLPVVDELLKAGADVNLEATSGRLRTPLIAAVSTTRMEDPGVMTTLIAKGADVRRELTTGIGIPSFDTSYHGSQPGSPLLAAIQNDESIFDESAVKLLVEKILEAGAREDVNRFVDGDDFGTPLIAAAASGLSDVVDLLLKNGADCNMSGHCDADWRLPSLAAVYGDQPALALKLLNAENYASLVTEAAAWGKCFIYVCSNGDSEESPDSDWTRLSIVLLDNGVDISYETNNKIQLNAEASLVDLPEAYGCAIIAACASGQKNLVTNLIVKGISEHPSSGGCFGTCLSAACKSENTELVQFLLDRSHDPNHVTPSIMYWCPLVAAAAKSGWQDDDALKILLDRGANPDAQYYWANPELRTADILETVFQRCKTWHRAFIVARMWESNMITGSSLAHALPFSGTPLIEAAGERQPKSVATLIEKGVDPGLNVGFGFYPSAMIASYDLKKRYLIESELAEAGTPEPTATEVLKYIRSFGFVTSEHFQESPKLIIEGSFWGNMLMAGVKGGVALPFLLEQGLDPNQSVPGSFYGTAMIAASALLESAAVNLFLENGTSIDIQTDHGAFGTPLIAICSGPVDFPCNFAFHSSRNLEDDEHWERTQLDLLEHFLDLGAKPNIHHHGLSPLIAFICCSSSKIRYGVELLLSHGADPFLEIPRYKYLTSEINDDDKWSAIQVARERGDEFLVEVMERHKVTDDA